MLKRILAVILLMLAPVEAAAQSLTPGCSSPPPAYGVVWTASQWIICLSSLQANLGYTPLNQAGGAMSGELFLSTSVTANAPLNFPPGVAPTSPANGDAWFTSAGMFLRVNGSTVGPLASAVSQTFNNPTFTGTVTFPDASTWTSAGAQNLAHLYVNRATDAGGAQLFQVQGGAYLSSGLSLGTTTAAGTGAILATGGVSIGTAAAQTGGIAVNTATSAGSVSAAFLDFSTTARLFSTGASISTYAGVTVGQYHSDLSGARTASLLDTSGNTQFPGTVSLGNSSTDFVTAAGGASGATLSTNGGTLTVSSGGGATTKLSDTAVQFSATGYHTCSLLGTDGSGNVTCGGAPSGYITYNDNITSDPGPAVTGNLYCANTASAAFNITLPPTPGNGNYVAISDCGGNFAQHNLTIKGNGSNIMYNAGDMTVSQNYVGFVLRYSTGKTSWILSPL